MVLYLLPAFRMQCLTYMHEVPQAAPMMFQIACTAELPSLCCMVTCSLQVCVWQVQIQYVSCADASLEWIGFTHLGAVLAEGVAAYQVLHLAAVQLLVPTSHASV